MSYHIVGEIQMKSTKKIYILTLLEATVIWFSVKNCHFWQNLDFLKHNEHFFHVGYSAKIKVVFRAGYEKSMISDLDVRVKELNSKILFDWCFMIWVWTNLVL